MSALYLYALLGEEPVPFSARSSEAGPDLGTGIAGEPLRRLAAAGFEIVAGELTQPVAASAAALAAHDGAVRRLGSIASAVLPFRFGQQVADRAALASSLAPRAAELSAALRLVAGCVQMTLRVFGDPASPTREDGIAEVALPAAAGPGTRYLAARLRADRAPLALPEVAALRAALRPLVRAERLERHGGGRLLLSAHDLVPAAVAADYRATVEAARARMAGSRSGPQVSMSGPWPAYAFGDAVLPSPAGRENAR